MSPLKQGSWLTSALFVYPNNSVQQNKHTLKKYVVGPTHFLKKLLYSKIKLQDKNIMVTNYKQYQLV